MHVLCSVTTINVGLLVVLAYAAAYMVWDPAAGASWAFCIALPLWALANVVRTQVRVGATFATCPLCTYDVLFAGLTIRHSCQLHALSAGGISRESSFC
jgi:uncharacterized membrane protein YGL010W